MINFAQPTEEERELLRQHYKKSPSQFTRQRAHAIILNSEGYSFLEISRVLFKTEKTICSWIKAFNRERISSIFSKQKFNQNAAKLTREQKEQIKKILSLPPSDFGLPKAFWEVKSLKKYIKAEFNVKYQSSESYYLIFKLCNFSYHTPSAASIHRNEKRIKERMQEIREEVSKYWEDNNWEILVADETRLVWQAIIRKAWFPKGKEGKKTVIKFEKSDEYQSFFGALNLKTGKPHLIKVNWQNQENIIKALKRLKRNYPNKKICLIWDNAGFHKGRILKGELKQGCSLEHYYLIALPPYAPEKNPQEKIWRYAKDEISNDQPSSFRETINIFRKIVMGRIYSYKI